MKWGLSKGIIFVKALLLRIQIQKEMFTEELIKGDALLIPGDLT